MYLIHTTQILKSGDEEKSLRAVTFFPDIAELFLTVWS